MVKMKDSGIEWIGEIPASWEVIKGKYLFTQRNSKGNELSLTLLSPTQKYGVIPQSMYEELTGMKPVKIDQQKDLNLFKTIHKGDFCISLRSFEGGFEYSNYEGVVSPAYQVFYLIDNNSIDTYYKYLFKDKTFIDKMNSYTMSLRDGKNISFNDFGNTYITVPPKAEQQQIADFLDHKTAEIDGLIDKINTEIDTLKQYQSSVITQAVTKGVDSNVPMKDSGIEWIGEIPTSWEVIKGKYLFTQRNSKGNELSLTLLSPTQKYGVIPQSMYEELTGMKPVKIDQQKDLNLFKTIHKGDFCISLRSFEGGFEYSNYEGVVSPAYQVFYLIDNNSIDTYYKYLFKDKTFIDKMNSYTMSLRDGKNISFNDFGNTYITVPPKAEQQQIADYLDQKVTKIQKLINSKQQQINQLTEYKNSLIFEYVTGKKQVKEAN